MTGRMVARSVARRQLASLVHLVFQFLPGMCFLTILAPRRFLRVSSADNLAFRRTFREMSVTPLILGFSFLVEVGVNLINPVDRVSLSSWTGQAVIQACGCGHP